MMPPIVSIWGYTVYLCKQRFVTFTTPIEPYLNGLSRALFKFILSNLNYIVVPLLALTNAAKAIGLDMIYLGQVHGVVGTRWFGWREHGYPGYLNYIPTVVCVISLP